MAVEGVWELGLGEVVVESVYGSDHPDKTELGLGEEALEPRNENDRQEEKMKMFCCRDLPVKIQDKPPYNA